MSFRLVQNTKLVLEHAIDPDTQLSCLSSLILQCPEITPILCISAGGGTASVSSSILSAKKLFLSRTEKLCLFAADYRATGIYVSL
jgi:hypothetical protein